MGKPPKNENEVGQKEFATQDDLAAMEVRIAEKLGENAVVTASVLVPKKTDAPTARGVFGDIKVKTPKEKYSDDRPAAKHYRTNRAVFDERGREASLPSERMFAKAGAFLKFLGRKAGMDCPLSEHETELLDGICEEDRWCGKLGGVYHDDIPGSRAKALLDDAVSGGSAVVPAFFDEAIIQFPLLHSELLPFVDLRSVPRGRNVEGASVNTPTVTWGTAEGTAQAAFNTAALVAALNSTIFPVSVNVETGRDFLADAAVDVGRILVENIGQRFAAELDEVIASGNGASEPQGIFTAVGVTDIGNPAGGAGAAAQVTDFESLLFGIAKQYRNAAYNPVFLSNDTSYQRARAIAVGAADERRVFGMDENSYRLLGWPYKIENNLANTRACFGALKKFRMYRRQGADVQWTTEGRTLAQANLALLVVRGRYGGRIVDVNAFAKQTNAQA